MTRGQVVLIAFVAAFIVLCIGSMAERWFSDARVQQAFVAGSFLAAGWILAFALRQLTELLDRAQRSKDVQEAFRAEIFDYSEAMDDENPEETARLTSRKVLEGGDGKDKYHPLVPRVSPPVVFEALAQDIHLLPQQTIDSVVQFYSVLSDVTIFAEDLMSPEFVAAQSDQRANALGDYVTMRGTLLKLSKQAIADLDNALSANGDVFDIAQILGTRMKGPADGR